MSYITRLITENVADAVKDHIDDLLQQGLLPNQLFTKSTSFRRVLNAINIADIDACRIIKQEMQMVILVPANTDEVFLDRAPQFIDPTETADFLADVSEETLPSVIESNQVFLNREMYIDASNIRSDFLHAYSAFPKGNTSPAYKIKIVGQDMFDNIQMRGGYDTPANGSMSVAYHEAATKRLRFAKTFSVDTYLSFPAYMIPSKVDYTDFADEEYNNYTVRTPAYAEQYLVYRALAKTLPIGSAGHQMVQPLLAQEEANIYKLIPQNTSIIEVSDGYIG